jgi:uncharacterized protein (TIGR02246 family)
MDDRVMATSISEAVKNLDEAFDQADLQAVLAFYEEDAVLVVEPGRLARGRDELKTFFQRAFALGGKAVQLETHVIESGDLALFTSRWRFTGVAADGTSFQKDAIATSVFRKGEDGGWRLVIDNAYGPAVLTGTPA